MRTFGAKTGNGSDVVYDVRAVLKTGKDITVVGGFNSHQQALFIERTAEHSLRIEDTPVPGEVHRRLV